MQPKYQTTALMQVHPDVTNNSMLTRLGYKSNPNASIENTQQVLIRSRYILEPVIQQNN